MATKTFEVKNYKTALGDRMTGSAGGQAINFRGYIICSGDDGYHLAIYFLNPSSPVPSPTYLENYKRGVIYLPFSQMQIYLDLLRNEKPIYGYMNSNRPEWNSIRTTNEPIGEEES